MQELKWPVDKCVNEKCGFDLREVPCKTKDKTGLSSDGLKKPMWCAYCPKCGKGYCVGYVDVPVPKEMTQEKAPIVLPSPDQETEEPEPEKKEEGKAGTPKVPGPGEFWCTKCASLHKETSKVGKSHSKKYREA